MLMVQTAGAVCGRDGSSGGSAGAVDARGERLIGKMWWLCTRVHGFLLCKSPRAQAAGAARSAGNAFRTGAQCPKRTFVRCVCYVDFSGRAGAGGCCSARCGLAHALRWDARRGQPGWLPPPEVPEV